MTLDRNDLFKLYLYYFVIIMIINFANTISMALIPGDLALLIAVIWMVVTIIFYFIIRNNNVGLIIYSSFNAVISGVAISAYYSIEGVLPVNSLFFLIIFGLLMIISYKIISKMKQNNLFIRINIGASILVMIVSIFIWIDYSSTLGSGMVLFCIVFLCFNIALLRVNKKDANYVMIVGYASLIMFGGILIAVLLALSDGNGIEIIGGGSQKRKRLE